jgi:hypothetical protein
MGSTISANALLPQPGALLQHPGATKIEGSRDVRDVPENDDELSANST